MARKRTAPKEVVEETLPTSVQLMVDAGIPNKTILTSILESNGKTYSEFVRANKGMMIEPFPTLVQSASNFK